MSDQQNSIDQIFQFTPLREGLQYLNSTWRERVVFQFTPLREGLPEGHRIQQQSALISIHAPARGASLPGSQKGVQNRFQFTPLREGLRYSVAAFNLTITISIHAPARGASIHLHHLSFYNCQFQFTPLREGLPEHLHAVWDKPYFNSRPCERGF